MLKPGNEDVAIGIPAEEDGEYNRQVLIPKEKKFAAASRPSIVNAQQFNALVSSINDIQEGQVVEHQDSVPNQ